MTTTAARRVDVLVVGAGTAGLGAAVQLARRGLEVVVAERRPMGSGGARWCNGVVPWQLTRAGYEPSSPPESRGTGGAIATIGPDGSGFRVEHSPVVDTDMRLLNARLLDEATRLGVEVIDGVGAPRVELRHGRIHRLRLPTDGGDGGGGDDGGDGGDDLVVEPSLVVDASGRAAVVRRQVPDLDRWCPDPRPDELCSASQCTFEVSDTAAALEFLDRHGVAPGDTVMWLGFAGGFSAASIQVSHDLSEVGVLTGTLGGGAWGTGASILELVRARHPWIGRPVFGGSGLIPLRAPYPRFTAPGLALVGDAAAQVFPAHGSGIGVGLIAGAVLAEAVVDAAGGADPGSAESLWRYQAGFLRELGGTLAAYDHVRRLSTAIGGDGVAVLLRAGLVDAESTVAGLRQEWVTPPPARTARQAATLARHPALAARIAPRLALAAAAPSAYRRYPLEPDPAALRRWSRLAGVGT